MSSLTIGDLVGYIRADGSDFERNLARSQLRMEGFQLDTAGRLRDLSGRFVRDTGVMGRALADSFSEAERAGTRITTVYSSVADAEARTLRARVARVRDAAQQMGRGFRQAFQEAREAWDRLNFDRLGKVASGFFRVAASIGKVGAMVGTAVPVVAGLASAVQAIAPAAAVAVTGLIAVRLAAGALKLGMIGVEDAVTAALDPSKAEDFEEALKKLSPSAQAFARQVKALSPEFRKLQQDVQERLFKGLDGTLKSMAKSTLPVLRKGLIDAAGSLNGMAKGVGAAAVSLAKDGALGRAVNGATKSLSNLQRAPGQVVKALGQVGAAAAPSLDKLTQAAGKAMDKFSEGFTRAFKSGQLEKAINHAIELVGELGSVARNVFKIIGSVFGAAETSGGGMIGVLKQITGELAKAFASKEVQGGLKAIFGVMSELGKAAGPVLVSLLKTLGEVLKIIGPPIRELVKHLGDSLLKIADKLRDPLTELGKAFGELVKACQPLIDQFFDLVIELLPALKPLFKSLGDTFKAAAPFLAELAKSAGDLLLPVFDKLANEVLPKVLPAFTEMGNKIFPILKDALVEMGPGLKDLGKSLGDLLVAATPLIIKVLELATSLTSKLLPILAPLIGKVASFAGMLLSGFSQIINRYVIPAVKAIAALLTGDFSGALQHAKTLGHNFAVDFASNMTSMKNRGSSAMDQLKASISRKAQEMGQSLASSVRMKVNETVTYFRNLPGNISRAMGGLGGLLGNAGRALINGLMAGIRSKVGELRAQLARITASLPSWKGPESTDARILVPAGRSVISGFMGGIASQLPALQRQLGGITSGLPGMALGTAGAYAGAAGAPQQRVVIEFRGPDALRDLIRDIVRVDGRGNAETTFGR
ncbi:hypothetical protein ACF09L_19265 [Streptomyces sp. NPDC014779]|uniref:phage tail protein n=1 Tax=Streptomyces sp. NPDC014779 TaxID=3364911 RepID=UPI003703620D